ncbi:hypothetical protein HFO72_33555 [Rhizobium laguerreae]|uniref:hypothetical protein n=1 Tax=Rhizobium laguerreae TaxID=1076926 RepID=UPI001C91166E|nr:hypothetical protein [Rhizobium laguerreae]MBY3095658.1 hypothetical protein [Rhizobium laguerreae]
MLITENGREATQRLVGLAQRFSLNLPTNDTTAEGGAQLHEILSQLPISTKESLMAFRSQNATTYLSEAILFAETSGTTGRPLQIPRTKADLIVGIRNYKEAYGSILRPSRDRVAFVHPSVLSPLRDLTVRALQDLDIGVMTLFPIPGLYGYERIHHALNQNQVTTLLTSPSIVHQILFNFHRLGLAFPKSIDKILVTGEYFSEQAARNIKRLVGRDCHVAPMIYGANEIGMMMYAGHDFDYRGITRDFIFECLPLESEADFVGHVAPSSKVGELLVTSLTPSIMPVIRYATRDVFNFIPSAEGTWTFRHIGRKDDFPISLRRRNKIDDLLYTLRAPIFHYNLTLSPDATTVAVQLLTPEGSLPGQEIRDIENELGSILGDSKRVLVRTDQYDGGFVEGECVSKVNRFNVAA